MLTKEKFEILLQTQNTPSISIYLPTYRMGNAQEDRIRLKNALSDAKDLLVESGKSEKESLKFLKKGFDLLEKADFFSHLSDGLAVFITEEAFYRLIVPIDFDPLVYLGQSFYLRQLIPLLNQQPPFYLLTLSQGNVKLFEIEQFAITPIKIKDVIPENIDEALALEETSDNIQAHSGNPNNTPVYHGQGAGKDQKNFELAHYFRIIDEGLTKILPDGDPLMIAAVDYLVPIFKDVAKYSNILEAHLSGNLENIAPGFLHEKALAALPDYFNSQRNKAIENFQAYAAENRATAYINDIIPAAIAGKVETLFTCKNILSWGAYDASSHKVSIHPEKQKDSVCLLNLAAVNTFQQGGQVFNLDRTAMPITTANVNAIYRYE
ncbi:MAG: hypothetical protein DHS20C18_36970 [Saprospiraceae bacterium]|nr:MAG: hypothetical protein DHS20C18_36970 [Saprospiraceae bacterium]